MFNFSQSLLAAKLQEYVSKRRDEVGLYKEIAEKLPLMDFGRLLDVGTGTGLQLKVIHKMNPTIELYGLDISDAAIQVACTHLAGIGVDLRSGNIENTSYKQDFFDIITCNASMSYWKNPGLCFNEIFRILKPGGCALLFEPHKNINIDEAVEIIKANLVDKSRLRRFMATSVNKFALRWGRQLGLTLYSIGEINEIADQSLFANSYSIEKVSLQNLPIFVKISLRKPDKDRNHRDG